jgi:hypothetical protein
MRIEMHRTCSAGQEACLFIEIHPGSWSLEVHMEDESIVEQKALVLRACQNVLYF